MPNAGSFLYAHQVPPEGGDTLFADIYAAFAELPADVQRAILGRRACFSRMRLHQVHYPHLPPLTEEQKRNRPDVWHPIARRHPKSGCTALYIGRWAYEIEGMADDEAESPSSYLQRLRARGRNSFIGTVGGSATRCCGTTAARSIAPRRSTTRHISRLMHRTTLEGEAPLMAETPVLSLRAPSPRIKYPAVGTDMSGRVPERARGTPRMGR